MKPSKNSSKKSSKRTPRDLFLTIFIIVLGVGVVITGIVFVLSRPEKTTTESLPREISVNEAFEFYQTGTLIVDVREKSEWNEVHVPNTVHIPLGDLEKRAKELPTDKEIIVLCRSGNRSQSGRDILLNKGFEQVTSVSGGIKDWISAGFPTVSGD